MLAANLATGLQNFCWPFLIPKWLRLLSRIGVGDSRLKRVLGHYGPKMANLSCSWYIWAWDNAIRPTPHECVFHALRCVASRCVRIWFHFRRCFIFSEAFLLMAWFSLIFIVGYRICHRIWHYRNGVFTYRDGTQRAVWKKKRSP